MSGLSESGRSGALLDHLVGAGEQCCGYINAQRLCGLEVDDEIELGWLYHRKVASLLALEDAADIDTGLAVRVDRIGTIAHQYAGFDNLSISADRRRHIAKRQCCNLATPAVEECIAS